MRIYNRTNIPERTAIEAVSLITTGRKGWDKERVSIEKLNDTIYQVKIFGYPPINVVRLDENSVTVILAEENDWYQNMKVGEASSIYFL